MPVSNLTCRRTGREPGPRRRTSSTNAGSQTTRDDFGIDRQCDLELLDADGTHHQQRRLDPGRAQLTGLVGRGNR